MKKVTHQIIDVVAESPKGADSENTNISTETMIKSQTPIPIPKVEMVKVKDLKPHPENARFYGQPKLNEILKNNIERLGIRQPLVVNADGTTLQGNSRLHIAEILGIEDVPVIRVDMPDRIDQLEMILSGNTQREKTNEERAREFQGHLEIESARAKTRQATNIGDVKNANAEKGEASSKPGSKKSKKAQHVKNSAEAEAETGKARDLAAEKVNWSGPTAANAAKVVEVLDALYAKEANSPILPLIREKLGTSVNAAFQECTRLELIKDYAKTSAKSKTGAAHFEGFSRSEHSFASRQFNPFTKDRVLNSKAMGWLTVREPSKSGDDDDRSAILALPPSMDLLHASYTDEVVNKFADELEKAPQWVCLVETREFDRVAKIQWPGNAWIGFTVSTQKDIDMAEDVIDSVSAKTKWIHCRLDSESLSFEKLDAFNWIVISLENESIHWEDVEPVFHQARKAKCRVFFDPSVKCRPKEFPKVIKAK